MMKIVSISFFMLMLTLTLIYTSNDHFFFQNSYRFNQKKGSIRQAQRLATIHNAHQNIPELLKQLKKKQINQFWNAFYKQNNFIVKKMLQKGDISPNIRDDLKTPLIHHLIRKKKYQLLKLLLSLRGDPNIPDTYGTLPIMIAVRMGNSKMTKLLFQYGADPRTIGRKSGFSPLIMAIYHGHLNIVTLLIDFGASPTQSTEGGLTPLIASIKFQKHKIFDYLLSLNIPINQKSFPFGETPLIVAIRDDNPYVFKKLLRHNVSLNTKTFEGITPLMSASISSNYRFQKILLKRNSSINTQDLMGHTALFWSFQKARWNNAIYILRHKNFKLISHEFNLIFTAIKYKQYQLVNLLLKKGSPPNIYNTQKETPLIAAIKEESYSIVKNLIRHRANILLIDSKGNTPLHWSILKGSYKISRLLLTAGANINQKNHVGDTPLILSVKNRDQSLTRYLLNMGAKRSIKNKLNKDAFYYGQQDYNLHNILKESMDQ